MGPPKSLSRAGRDEVAGAAHRGQILFFAAVAALGAAVLVFVFVLVSVARDGGGGSGGPAVPPGTTTDGGTVTTPAGPGDTATPTGSSATTTTTTEPAEGRQLACGDIMAALNKLNFLAQDCAPNDLQDLPQAMSQGRQFLRAEARGAFIDLVSAAAVDGFTLYAISGYRSYQDQIAAYNSNLAGCGQNVACADRISARPGHSEHQLGTTMDVSSASAGFGLESFQGTPEARWLADNAWRFGFVVSYPEGSEQITGYAFEPWHIRYIGKTEAKKVRDSGLTLHEYLARRP